MKDNTSQNDVASSKKMKLGVRKYSDAQRMKHVRLAAAEERGIQKLSQVEFGRLLGVNASTISHIEAGTIRIQRDLARLLEEKTGFRQAWLLTGEEPKRFEGAFESCLARSYSNLKGPGQVDFDYVRKVKPRLSAGDGELVTDDNCEDIYSFRRDWLLQKGSHTAMRLAEITGDSMMPTLKDGDLVLFDTTRNDPLDGRIMVVGIDDLLYIKRVRVSPFEGTFLVSDNKAVYKPWRIDLQYARFFGLVIWHCGEL